MKCTSEDCTDESMEDMIYCEYHGKLHGQEEVSLVTTRLNRNLDSLNALYNILFSLGIAGITFLVLMLVNGINHDGKFLVTQL